MQDATVAHMLATPTKIMASVSTAGWATSRQNWRRHDAMSKRRACGAERCVELRIDAESGERERGVGGDVVGGTGGGGVGAAK